ncbi:MAG TPA: SRPBCC domain-containing protein, partial [Polyangiaceae bacterium]|nr:SRPBCC domain-containing protein [Polyangiaceae bacterium]
MSATKGAPSLTYVRRIRATPAKVWNAFVDPRELVHWWGPDAGPTLSAETDVRIGGAFKIVFRTMAGEQFESHGEYLELDPPR